MAARAEGRELTKADLAAYEVADAAEDTAMDAVFALPIRTPSDLRALADWAAELHDAGSDYVASRLLNAMRASPLLAA